LGSIFVFVARRLVEEHFVSFFHFVADAQLLSVLEVFPEKLKVSEVETVRIMCSVATAGAMLIRGDILSIHTPFVQYWIFLLVVIIRDGIALDVGC
jgi:hypothetical protein